MNQSFWAKRRVFVTGHTGFKGGWLSLWLQAAGAEVVGYALQPPTEPNLFGDAKVTSGMRVIEGDVRDESHLRRCLAECRPDVVFHLAAQPIVRTSYRQPLETLATNALGTANLLEAVRQTSSVRVCVCITSDKCYSNREWHWGYREDESLGGKDPYSASKACAEIIAGMYRQAFLSVMPDGPALATARAGNVIGGGDWAADRLVPDTVRSFLVGQPVLIRYPRSTRPWQHVLVPLSGYVQLAEAMWNDARSFAEAWNFGPAEGDAWPVQRVVETMSRQWGRGASWALDAAPHLHEDCYLKLDCSKAHERLGWSPVLRLRDALEWVVEWYQAWADRQDVRGVTLDQIGRFEQLRQDADERLIAVPPSPGGEPIRAAAQS